MTQADGTAAAATAAAPSDAAPNQEDFADAERPENTATDPEPALGSSPADGEEATGRRLTLASGATRMVRSAIGEANALDPATPAEHSLPPPKKRRSNWDQPAPVAKRSNWDQPAPVAKWTPPVGKIVDPVWEPAQYTTTGRFDPSWPPAAQPLSAASTDASADEMVRTEDVEVPLNAVGLVIGKGGENLKRLMVQSCAHIQFEKDVPPGATHKIAHVQGPPEEIRAAKALIQQIIDQAAEFQRKDAERNDSALGGSIMYGPSMPNASGPASQTAPPATSSRMDEVDEVEEVVLVPNQNVGAVIGKGGETMKMLAVRTGAKIQVLKDADHNPADPQRPITLIGRKEEVDEARRLIMDTITRAQAGRPLETPLGAEHNMIQRPPSQVSSQVEEHVFVPNYCVGPIVGKAGSTIQMMQQQVRSKSPVCYAESLGGDRHQQPACQLRCSLSHGELVPPPCCSPLSAACEMLYVVLHSVVQQSKCRAIQRQVPGHRRAGSPSSAPVHACTLGNC